MTAKVDQAAIAAKKRMSLRRVRRMLEKVDPESVNKPSNVTVRRRSKP